MNLPARPGVAATVTAIAVGLAWAVTPLGLPVAAALIAVCAAATADLAERERQRVRLILAAAIGVRLLVLAAVFVATPASRQAFALFPDALDLIDRSAWLRNVWLDVPLGAHQYMEVFNPVGASSWTTVLAILQVPAGPSPFALSFLSAAIYVAGTLVAFRVVRRGFGPTASLAGLVLLLFWPSLLAWSISVLKEPVQLCLASIVFAGAALLWSSSAREKLAWIAMTGAALAVLSTLRAGGLEIAAGGIALAAAIRLVSWRRWVVAVLLLAAIAGGWRARDRIASEVRLAAARHVGHVKSAGVSYRLLEPRYYEDTGEAVSTMPLGDGVRFLFNAAVAFVVVPLPWQAGSRGTVALLPQQFAWDLMCLAAVVGFAVGMRRSPWTTCVLAGSALAGLLVIAPNSGNIGTLVRHRDLIVPFVLWLGGLGVVTVGAAGERQPVACEQPV